MSKFEQMILSYYPYFHKFTLTCVICVLSYKAITYDFQPEVHTITWVLEILAPDFLKPLSGGDALDPSDFVTN